MAISEKITLLGAGLYQNIPDVLTLKAIPTASELDYVGAEDFQATMLDVILPRAVEEQCNFRELLEIDFHWVCRCLRILNYGPYYTTNSIYCSECGAVSHGEYQVNLNSINVLPLPEKFSNSVVISRNEFIDFKKDITLHLPTIQDAINAAKDPFFKDSHGDINIVMSRLCYMISAIGGDNALPVPEIKRIIQTELSSADFFVLKTRARELTDFGLRAGGSTMCPKCQSRDATFVALVDDRFFRPTLGDLRAWKADRDAQRRSESTTGVGESGIRNENLLPNAPTKV